MDLGLALPLGLERGDLAGRLGRRGDSVEKVGDFGVAGVGSEKIGEKACFVATIDHCAVVDEVGQAATEALLGCEVDARVAELGVRKNKKRDGIEEIHVDVGVRVEEVENGEIVL